MSEDNDIRQTVSSQSKKTTKSITFGQRDLLTIVVVVVVGLLGFWGGLVYQKHHTKSAVAVTANGRFGAGGNFSTGRVGGGFGSVTAVSSTSITIDTRSGTSKTYAITASTTITDAGQTVAASSIQTGERVIVAPSSSNAADAATIVVNPGFGGGPGGGSQGSSTSTPGSSTN